MTNPRSQVLLTSATSESVSPGHPDKLADAMADAVLDRCLGHDRTSRVACEVLICGDHVLFTGEISSTYDIENDLPELVKTVARSAGYIRPVWGFDPDRCTIESRLRQQNPGSSPGGEHGKQSVGTADQGIMIGYATDETQDLMPLPIHLAHNLMRSHAALVRTRRLPWLGPDAQAQVTVSYQDDRPVAIDTVVLSTQHLPEVPLKTLREEVLRSIIKPVLPASLCHEETRTLINPSGRFVGGGPAANIGFTGRKIMVDAYGTACPHGGGAFSGKDPSRLDRSGAYMARYIAKNVVAAGLAQRCTVQLTYATGQAEPIAFTIDLHQSRIVTRERLETIVREQFALEPAAIIQTLSLDHPIYQSTATLGHFGRVEPGFTWERLDRVKDLRQACQGAPDSTIDIRALAEHLKSSSVYDKPMHEGR